MGISIAVANDARVIAVDPDSYAFGEICRRSMPRRVRVRATPRRGPTAPLPERAAPADGHLGRHVDIRV
jgi:hypothetical protein